MSFENHSGESRIDMRRSEIDRDQNLESEHRHFLAIRFRLVTQHTDFDYDSYDAEQLQII